MIKRLANVIYWVACCIGVLILLIGVFVASREVVYNPFAVIIIFAVAATLIWLIGLAIRYVLVGPKAP
jgi:hypothetical protein